jgi:hypothetical protein
MFYMGEDIDTKTELCGYATSLTATGPFTKYRGNPVLKGCSGNWDTGEDRAADPFVIIRDEWAYVGVTGTSDNKRNGDIGLFATRDFKTFIPLQSNPVLPKGKGDTWDQGGVLRGAVFLDRNGNYHLAYSGYRKYGQAAMGIADFSF